MIKEKLRSEIKEEDKWDLTGMYRDIVTWQEEYKKIDKEIEKLRKYENHILDSANMLENTLNDFYDIDSRVEKLYVYASCNFSVDMEDAKNQKLKTSAKNLYEKYSNITSYIFPEILNGKWEVIEGYINENVNLYKYKTILERLFKKTSHILSKAQEELFVDLSGCVSNFSDCSDYLRDQIMDFGFINDEEGNKVELTAANYSKFITSRNRTVRKEAYYNMLETYKHFNNSLASNYIGHIKYTTIEAHARNYNSVLEQDLDSLNIPKSVFDSLLKAAHKHIDVYQKNLKLIKKVLRVDELKPYDLSAPLMTCEREYSYEEARKIILDAAALYGKEFYNIASTIFEKRWIDVLPNKNKQNGWYQNGSYLTHPVIFANYFSKYIDVSSLAHELGHAVNDIFAKKNPYFLYNPSLFTAEVASLTNEMVVAKNILKNSNDNKEKLEVLDTIISVFSSNFFNGVKGAEFEYKAHQLVENKKSINAEVLNNLWKEGNFEYHQGVLKEGNCYAWARIPHFFRDYYYYKYATGVAAAMYLSDKIVEGTKEDKESYISFLEVGDSLEPIDALKKAGIDMTRQEVYEQAILSYDKVLDQYLEIYEKEYCN